jgi:hypothetical protein
VLDEGHFPVTLRLMHLKRLKTGEVNIMYSLILLIERNSQWGLESGRKTLEKSPLKEEQSRARLMESSRCCWAFTSDSLVRGDSDQSHR